MGNLHIAFDPESGTIGSRLNFQGNVQDLDNLLCILVRHGDIPSADQACQLFKALLEPFEDQLEIPIAGPARRAPAGQTTQVRYGSEQPARTPVRAAGRCRMRTRMPAVVVAAVSCALTLSACEAYDLPLPGSPVDEDHSFEVTAEFRDVLNLVPRSPVKVNDVTVGEVTEVERTGWNAAVRLRLQDDVDAARERDRRHPADQPAGREVHLAGGAARARRRAVSSPTATTSRSSQTGRNPELEEVLGALAFLLNGGGIGQLKTITTEINKVFDGRQDRIRHVLGELETADRRARRAEGATSSGRWRR